MYIAALVRILFANISNILTNLCIALDGLVNHRLCAFMAALSTANVCTKAASDCFCGVKSHLIASIVPMSLLTVKYEAVSN